MKGLALIIPFETLVAHAALLTTISTTLGGSDEIFWNLTKTKQIQRLMKDTDQSAYLPS